MSDLTQGENAKQWTVQEISALLEPRGWVRECGPQWGDLWTKRSAGGLHSASIQFITERSNLLLLAGEAELVREAVGLLYPHAVVPTTEPARTSEMGRPSTELTAARALVLRWGNELDWHEHGPWGPTYSPAPTVTYDDVRVLLDALDTIRGIINPLHLMVPSNQKKEDSI